MDDLSDSLARTPCYDMVIKSLRFFCLEAEAYIYEQSTSNVFRP